MHQLMSSILQTHRATQSGGQVTRPALQAALQGAAHVAKQAVHQTQTMEPGHHHHDHHDHDHHDRKCALPFNTDVTQSLEAHANEPSVTTVGKNVVLVASHDYDQDTVRIAVFRSTDGGRSFGPANVMPVQAPLNTAGDPYIRSCGKLVLLSGINFERPGQRSDIVVYRSCDAGRSFQGPITVQQGSASILNDKPYQALRAGLAVVAYAQFDLANEVVRILVQRSTDGGLTWSEPLTLATGEALQGTCVAFGPRGSVYVSWMNYVSGEFQLAISRDCGQSYSAPTVVATFERIGTPQPPFEFRTPTFSTLAVCGKEVYACWMGLLNNRARIFFSRSRDAGKSWSCARIIDQDGAAGSQNLFPAIAIAQQGPRVVFYSNRCDFTRLEVLMVRPLEQSAPCRVSRTLFNPSGTSLATFLGDYIDLAFHDGKAFTVWTAVPTQFEQIMLGVTEAE